MKHPRCNCSATGSGRNLGFPAASVLAGRDRRPWRVHSTGAFASSGSASRRSGPILRETGIPFLVLGLFFLLGGGLVLLLGMVLPAPYFLLLLWIACMLVPFWVGSVLKRKIGFARRRVVRARTSPWVWVIIVAIVVVNYLNPAPLGRREGRGTPHGVMVPDRYQSFGISGIPLHRLPVVQHLRPTRRTPPTRRFANRQILPF
jgi:hypothetical protein